MVVVCSGRRMRLERRRGSPPSEGGVAAASADGVVHECEARRGSRDLGPVKLDVAEKRDVAGTDARVPVASATRSVPVESVLRSVLVRSPCPLQSD